MIVIVEIVGGDLLPRLDRDHGPTGEGEVVVGETDGVGGAGVVQDGHDGKQSLDVGVLVGILTDDVGVGVKNTDDVADFILRELFQFAMVLYKVHYEILPL